MLTVEQESLIFWLVIWVIVAVLVIRNQWSKKIPSAGLPFIYLLSLSMIHWFGGLIYALPWYQPTAADLLSQGISRANVVAGFNESVYGIIGFGLGSTIMATSVLKMLKPSWLYELPRQPNLKLPKTYIFLGLFLAVILIPLSGLPGFNAISTSAVSLFIVALCLACWKAWYTNDQRAFIVWLTIACSAPLISVPTLGFISSGAAASLVVLVFVFNFYRPRWKVILIALLALVLGLSVFVTYLRDRNEIRAKVWGGQSSETRIEQVWQTISKFEIFDPFKQQHLEAIDRRLNQNVLVGQAAVFMSNGGVNYAGGETLGQAVLGVVPRILWPDKPVFAGSGDIVSRYTGKTFAVGTSVGVGQVLEFYINFGSWGVFFGFLAFGTVVRIFDIVAGKKLVSGNWVGFVSWFLPGLGLIQPGGSLVEVVSSTSASIVLVCILNRVALPKKIRGTVLRT
jgi:hypothetical protein